MEENNNGINNNTPPTMPVKRKRGRPRKDKSLKIPKEVTPTLNFPPPLNSVGDPNGSLVGQSVRGVIEASFDAGFLLNVNIGNSGTCLRGVVFKPGHYFPVSAENDVAPHIQMINRKKIPLPKGNQNDGYIGNTSCMENEKPLHNNGLFSESTTSKGMVKPVVVEPFSSLNGSFQNRENSERVHSDKNGIPMPNKANKSVEIFSQTLDGHLANGDNRNEFLDLEKLPFMQSVNNNNQFQEAPGSYNNSRMGPMSMLLQVVQEKMVKPGDLS